MRYYLCIVLLFLCSAVVVLLVAAGVVVVVFVAISTTVGAVEFRALSASGVSLFCRAMCVRSRLEVVLISRCRRAGYWLW